MSGIRPFTVVVTIAIVGLAALPVAVTARPAKRHACTLAHSRVLLRDPSAVVFIRKDRKARHTSALRRLYACAPSVGRVRRISGYGIQGIGERSGDVSGDGPALAGRYVAYVQDVPDADNEVRLVVADARTGHQRAVITAGDRLDGYAIHGFLLRSDGAIAWTSDSVGSPTPTGDHPFVVAVNVAAPGRSPTTVDHADYSSGPPPIDTDSLAANRSGSLLYWLHDGQPRSAPFA